MRAFVLVLLSLALCACAGQRDSGGRVDADNHHGSFQIFRRF